MVHVMTMGCSNFGSRSPEAVLPDLQSYGNGCGGRQTTEEKERRAERYRFRKQQRLSLQLPFEQRRGTILSGLSDKFFGGQEAMDKGRS
eukprot:8093020-Heterocapsa_arctica.AAC.1